MSDRDLIQCAPSEIASLWDRLSALLPEWLDREEVDFRYEDIFHKLTNGEWILWAVHNQVTSEFDAFFATSILTMPSGKRRASIEFMVGPAWEEWLPYVPLVEEWALGEGCASIEMLVPRAFARHLPDYRLRNVQLERAL